MANWDVFHSERLEVERGLSTPEVRAALAKGEVGDDDLIRPAGSSAPWTRLGDMPDLFTPGPEPETSPPHPADEPPAFPDDFERGDDLLAENEFEVIDDDVETEPPPAADEPDVREVDDGPYSPNDLRLRDRDREDEFASSSLELVTWDDDLDVEEYDPQDEDEAAAEFTLSRGAAEKVEELDLAAMVDVAFQLVLFFLVTATTVLYKSLEVPKPNPENSPTAAAAQGRSKTIDDFKDVFILVEVDPTGAIKVDHEPVAATLPALAERLRAAREQTDRKAMLLSADFTTPHKSAVLAYDAANEIGLGIAIARPTRDANPGPAPAAAKAP